MTLINFLDQSYETIILKMLEMMEKFQLQMRSLEVSSDGGGQSISQPLKKEELTDQINLVSSEWEKIKAENLALKESISTLEARIKSLQTEKEESSAHISKLTGELRQAKNETREFRHSRSKFKKPRKRTSFGRSTRAKGKHQFCIKSISMSGISSFC